MSNLTVEIKAPELTEVLRLLANSIGGNKGMAEVIPGPIVEYGQQALQVQSPVTPVQVQTPAPVSVPVAPVQAPTPAPVPVAPAPTYSLSDLQVACAPLMDAGKQQDIANLLRNVFGVEALTLLPLSSYGEFATALRGLGAKI